MKAGKLMRATAKIVKGTIHLTKKNSNWILAGLAVLGITGVAWSAIQGTIKAVKLCEEKGVKGGKEVLKTTWKLYIPTLGFFILTTVSVLGNAGINAKRIATLTGLYAMSQADLAEFRKQVKEVVGAKKTKEIEAEATKERMKAMNLPAPLEGEIAKTGHGKQLFLDWTTGQFFRASPEYIELVAKELNERMQGEVDSCVHRRFLTEKFSLRHNGTDDYYWDFSDMVQEGFKEIELDCSHTSWMEVNGQREIVCTMKCIPEATCI